MSYKKKLIEVALPLDEINDASSKEKSIRQGHPSTLHLWWARRPLASCRSVLLAQLIDDPSEHLDKFPTKKQQDRERQRLMDLIAQAAPWKSIENQNLISDLKKEIAASKADEVCVLDPFSGGGSIPLEAVRLGLHAVGGDLNPVATIISKATAAIPKKFSGMKPKHPNAQSRTDYVGLDGLSEDIRCFGDDLLSIMKSKIGKYYPKVTGPKNESLDVVAWLWVRTVKSPNPAFSDVEVPLVRQNFICTKEGNRSWVKVKFDKKNRKIVLVIESERAGDHPPELEKYAEALNFKDFASGGSIPQNYIRETANSVGLGYMPLAIVASGGRNRLYLSFSNDSLVEVPSSEFLDEHDAPRISGYFNPPLWGHKTFGSLFHSRQKFALQTFSEEVLNMKNHVQKITRDEEYTKFILLYLTLGVGRIANRLSSFTIWNPEGETIEQTFSEQGVPMVWDFAEPNLLGDATGSWSKSLEYIYKVVQRLPTGHAEIINESAAKLKVSGGRPIVISTDPPYFSSITYADFADFFYLPFRSILKEIYPDIFRTITSPKTEEAVAAWHRFDGDKAKASQHFKTQLGAALKNSSAMADDAFPLTIYYAFKSTEISKGSEGIASAWESILDIIIDAGLQVVRTWPLRTERISGRKASKNVLASSIVIVCRKIKNRDSAITQREFISEVKKVLPNAIELLKEQRINPADLPQAIVGVGMEIFSKYRAVIDSSDKKLTVRDAISIINDLSESTTSKSAFSFDEFTQWALLWLQINGFNEGEYGEALKIAQAKSVDLDLAKDRGIIESKSAKIKLVAPSKLVPEKFESKVSTASLWEISTVLASTLAQHGEYATATLLSETKADVQTVRDVSYRAFELCEKHKTSSDAILFKGLIESWDEIVKASKSEASTKQLKMGK